MLLIFCHVRKISFLAFADLGVHGLFIGQLIGRWGNFMNVEAYGDVTALPWRMCSESIARDMLAQGYVDQAGYQAILSGSLGVHPTFLYESLWNLAGLFMVYHIGKKRRFDGQCFLFYLFWYGAGRAWIEGLRTDSLYFFDLQLFGVPIRVSQMLAALSALAAGAILLWLMWRQTRGEHKALYVERIAAQKNTQADSPEQDSQTQAEAQPDAGEDRPKEDGEDPEQQKKE